MNNRDRFGNQIDPNTQPDNLEDSTNTEIQSLPPKLYMWKLSETLGNRTIIPADTASLNFQSTNLVEGMFGHYNYLGNLGSPRLSRLFFEREESEPTIFMAPFSSFFTDIATEQTCIEVRGGLVLVITAPVQIVDVKAKCQLFVDVDGEVGLEAFFTVHFVAGLVVGKIGVRHVAVSEKHLKPNEQSRPVR